MVEPHIIQELRRKRAELAGDIIVTRKRLERLNEDLDCIDRSIHLFDPGYALHAIRPVIKRRSGTNLFKHGDGSRAILSLLRTAQEPMTAREIADRLIIEYKLDVSAGNAADRLRTQVKTNLANNQKRGVLASDGGNPARWSVQAVRMTSPA
jgi:hypothetical protein